MTVEEWLGKENKLGVDIWYKKYCDNNESFDEWLNRISNNNGKLKQLIIEKKFLFGGRILSNRGLNKNGEKVTYSNCYVVTPPEDSIESIFECAKKLARTFSYGGGVGIDISKLAPRGSKVNNTAKETSGAVSFMDLYSMVTGLIGQNGRRGALMISIDCNHPDLEEFIDIKSDLDRVTKANISIKITKEFMDAVINDTNYDLKFIRKETGEEIVKTVNAKNIFHKIAGMNWDFAEPGFLYWDRIKSWNLLSNTKNFEYAGTNPCFTGDMKLLTSDGYKTFKELDGSNINIINVDGNITEGKVWCSGQKETIRLKLSDKSIIKCTPNHIFMTIDGNECMAKDLKGKKLSPLLIQKSVLDNEYLKLGFIQGDGQLSRLKSPVHQGIEVNIGYKDGDIRDLFSDENFTEKSDREIYLDGYLDKLRDLEFSEENLPTRLFPNTYNNWTHIQKASFLQGCYSANGSVIKDTRLSYKTTCREFANELVNTLQNDFDINAYITTNKAKSVRFENGEYECRESYDINIHKYKDIQKFHQSINFYQQYKRTQLQELLKNRTLYVSSITNGDTELVYDFTEPERHWGIVEGVIVHNCAEEPLPAGGSCLLGSINLSEFVKDNQFDFNEFKNTVDISVRALNNVLEEGLPLHPLQEQRDSVEKWRQIGLGIFGLSDLLIKLGITYGSESSITLCDKIGKLMINQSLQTSSLLAKKYGSFSDCNIDEIMNTDFFKYNATKETKVLVKTYGLRNSQLLTIAPTGTLSTMLGVSGGIEPIYANYYERTTQSLHGKDVVYKVYTPIVEKYMKDNNISDEKQLPNYFITAQDLNYINRINLQSIWQKHIDASISSTVNVPNSFTVEDVENLYMYGHEMGLKGVTIFRDGCKRSGILNTNTDKPVEVGTKEQSHVLQRGDILLVNDDVIGKKRKLTTGCGSLHCSAWFDPVTGDLLETFFNKGSSGGCNNFMIGLSRMISLCSRLGGDIYTIVDQLNSCGLCSSYTNRTVSKHDTSKGACCPMAIGNALISMYKEVRNDLGLDDDDDDDNLDTLNTDSIKEMDKSIDNISKVTTNNTETIGNALKSIKPKLILEQNLIDNGICPQCGNKLVHSGGCIQCSCGWSKCL